ncbi:pyruvate, water dikinase regulatory protein [Companilactobacillus metriopterae]|uniref:pyruvate, water dikinase regulatory protein n=1 Tax=Companilactobacillus metriopterae TaxID=1909267 RepID=UPI00100B568B|nr:pyruvate, water dikinase regulatory protein [Companilactobacillus metriopterae]
MTKQANIFVISDSAGETADSVAHAALAQFTNLEVNYTKYPFVTTKEKIDAILASAKEKDAIVLHTIISKEFYEQIDSYCKKENLICFDILNPIVNAVAEKMDEEPLRVKGLTHRLNDDYFDKISAMEFTVNNDDGKNPKGLLEADLVLLGISRTSKSPLSLYLANQNIKVANLPLVPSSELPKEIWEVDPKRIIGLTNDMNVLMKIRKQRMIAYGLNPDTVYSDESEIQKELDYSNGIYEKIGCPVINVADRSIEETAALIMEQLNINGFKKTGL